MRWWFIGGVAALAGTVGGQVGPGGLTHGGVARASARVDSVFIDRTVSEIVIAGADFGSYLIARLGVVPIPPDLRLQVTVDSQRILIHGSIRDLPAEARAALGPLLGMFPTDTPVAADVELARVAVEVVRFRLAAVRVRGLPLPETLVAAVMWEVGQRYPVLGKSGRDLFVQIPRDGEVELMTGGVRLRTVANGGRTPPARKDH